LQRRHLPRGNDPAANIGAAQSAPALSQSGLGVYQPRPINSFGDRVTNAIHAYPLQRSLGNNPVNEQMFIRQRADQP
jgi:hypothetical protein